MRKCNQMTSREVDNHVHSCRYLAYTWDPIRASCTPSQALFRPCSMNDSLRNIILKVAKAYGLYLNPESHIQFCLREQSRCGGRSHSNAEPPLVHVCRRRTGYPLRALKGHSTQHRLTHVHARGRIRSQLNIIATASL